MSVIPTSCLTLLVGILCANLPTNSAKAETPRVLASLDIAPVWSGHRVGFSLLTQPPYQFAAFYDAERQMTVVARRLDSTQWQMVRLPETLGWDSHNYVTMALDDDGHLHLSGNMHCVPLIYFRTREPYAIDTFERVPQMVGSRENRCTYPRFSKGANGKLIFTYRDGSSGNGDQLYNVYHPQDQSWHRLLDQPLTSGEGKMNAYLHGPRRGPDGFFHLCWVWRDTPDCATNHDLCYARSRDLVHWETSQGMPLALPITLATADVVDPVPAGGGIINGNTVVGFDHEKRPILSYHKFDAVGNTQIYNARLTEEGWQIQQVSQWDYRWEFHGGGSIPFQIRVGVVHMGSDGTLRQSYRHPKYGSAGWILDETTLRPVGQEPAESTTPRSLAQPEQEIPGIEVRWCSDAGTSGEASVRYALRWESLGPNRDRPHEGPLPEASMLRLYKLTQ